MPHVHLYTSESAEEKNEANLVQQSIEADEQSDPMFRRMAAAFDAGGAKGLLLSHLPLAEVGKLERWRAMI